MSKNDAGQPSDRSRSISRAGEPAGASSGIAVIGLGGSAGALEPFKVFCEKVKL